MQQAVLIAGTSATFKEAVLSFRFWALRLHSVFDLVAGLPVVGKVSRGGT